MNSAKKIPYKKTSELSPLTFILLKTHEPAI